MTLSQQPKICVVLPAFNEGPNLEPVLAELMTELDKITTPSLVVIVDDGSTDETQDVLKVLQGRWDRLRCERLSRNAGKAAALQAGFHAAVELGASQVVMMDADGQDDPSELARLLQQLNSGFDLVTGARLQRKDRFIKRSTSRLYNWSTGALSGVSSRDFNSGFKAMTVDTATTVSSMLYGEMHRYITVLAFAMGFRVVDVPVNHRPRLKGKSKYGVSRFWRGFMDLLTVRFLMSFRQRPSHLFGAFGIISTLCGFIILAYLLVAWLSGQPIGDRPLLTAGVLLVVVGLQLLLFGLMAEIIVFSNHQKSRFDR